MQIKTKLRLARVIAVVAAVVSPKKKYPNLNLIHYISFYIVETELRLFCGSSVSLLCLIINNDII